VGAGTAEAGIGTGTIIAIIVTGAAGNGRCAVRVCNEINRPAVRACFLCYDIATSARLVQGRYQELAMKTLIGAAVIAGVLMLALALAGSAAIDPAMAASPKADARAADVSPGDRSARHRYRPDIRYAYRRYDRPYYYDRPTYYRPYPYGVPVPFFLGFAFGPWW
jgi:hypothetical protein